ncbi:lysophosphatidic acid receptor 6-like [Centropristis striata]|uniref:lysophosphatidic acid receptor 6-like n=1 Tax=Centropristis striata TaxID=184440 RepID=UPI0027DF56B5|nr:lysophosphatidic acid receptor 6-like [Centropristis striata]
MNNTMEAGPEPKLGYALFYGSIMALGLPLNAVSLWILLRHHSLKTPSAVFMVNLAISDLLLVISLPMRVYFYATGTWPLSGGACTLITMLFRDNIRSSSIFITFISVDRLLAVVYPLRSRHLRTACNALKAVGLAWLIVLVINIPERVIFSRFLESYNKSTCFEFPQQEPQMSAMVYPQPVIVLTMLAVNIVCTTLVSWTLHTHLSDSARVNNKINVMLIFIMNLVMFTICFLPISVGLLIIGTPVPRPLICLATVNCCLDPLLYYFSLDAFWKKKEDADLPRE